MRSSVWIRPPAGALSLLAVTALLPAANDAVIARAAADTAAYEVYAIRYAALPDFPVRALVAGADSARRMEIAMMLWLLRGPDGRNVLVDAGFYRDRFLERWQPKDFRSPAAAVAAAGVPPEEVTDIIVTHVHWDHLDGVDLFPNARVWIQRAEFEHHVDASGGARRPAIAPENAAALAALREAGRLQLVEGDAQEILPGITCYTGGRHTHASQYVGVRTRAGTVVIASDNAYLYENLQTRTPIAQTLDPDSNLRAQERMARIASDPVLIVPGHDPAVLERFPRVADGVVRID